MTESKAALWGSRVAEWRASGETAEAFCARHGLVASTLRWWASQRKRDALPEVAAAAVLEPAHRRRRRKSDVVRLARVVRAASPSDVAQQGAIAIELLDARVRITVAVGADQKTLATVLDMVAARVRP